MKKYLSIWMISFLFLCMFSFMYFFFKFTFFTKWF